MTVNFTTWKGITDGQTYSIPDGLVAQWQFAETSGTILASDNAGVDVTLSRDLPRISDDDYNGGVAPNFDPSENDIGRTEEGALPDVGDTGSFTITVLFESTDGTMNLMGAKNSGTRLAARDDGQFDLRLGEDIIRPSPTYNLNEKYRAGVSWDTGNWQFALNGDIVDSGTYSGTVSFDSNWYFEFGWREGTGWQHDGPLDFPRFWKIALDDDGFSEDMQETNLSD